VCCKIHTAIFKMFSSLEIPYHSHLYGIGMPWIQPRKLQHLRFRRCTTSPATPPQQHRRAYGTLPKQVAALTCISAASVACGPLNDLIVRRCRQGAGTANSELAVNSTAAFQEEVRVVTMFDAVLWLKYQPSRLPEYSLPTDTCNREIIRTSLLTKTRLCSVCDIQ
jgi:hypothetical protein